MEVKRIGPLDTVNETLRAENATLRENNDAFQVKEEAYKHEVEKWQGQKHSSHDDQIRSVTPTPSPRLQVQRKVQGLQS